MSVLLLCLIYHSKVWEPTLINSGQITDPFLFVDNVRDCTEQSKAYIKARFSFTKHRNLMSRHHGGVAGFYECNNPAAEEEAARTLRIKLHTAAVLGSL